MLGEPSCEWFDRELRKVKSDPAFWLETHLYRFQEEVWRRGKPNGINLILYRIMEWSAGKLIDRM